MKISDKDNIRVYAEDTEFIACLTGIRDPATPKYRSNIINCYAFLPESITHLGEEYPIPESAVNVQRRGTAEKTNRIVSIHEDVNGDWFAIELCLPFNPEDDNVEIPSHE